MALTVVITRRNVAGHQNIVTGTIAFDSSYPTGGESFAPADLGLKVHDLVLFQTRSGFVFDYDYTNSKVLVYTQGAVTGATAAAGTTGTLMLTDAGVEGTARLQSATVSTTNKWGALLEVTATTSLVDLTGVRFVVFGV